MIEFRKLNDDEMATIESLKLKHKVKFVGIKKLTTSIRRVGNRTICIINKDNTIIGADSAMLSGEDIKRSRHGVSIDQKTGDMFAFSRACRDMMGINAKDAEIKRIYNMRAKIKKQTLLKAK